MTVVDSSVASGSSAGSTATDDPADDLALLRTHEPVLAYTKGEYFLPTDIERYIAAASLWLDGEKAAELVPAGHLDLAALLAASDAHPQRRLFLRYVLRPAWGGMCGGGARRIRRGSGGPGGWRRWGSWRG